MNTKTKVLDQLRQLVYDLAAAGDARIPPERDLAVRLGVTRTVLRAALRVLESEGQIWRHVGRGTFVGPQPSSDELRPEQIVKRTSPVEVMEARRMLEPEIAGLAAMRATLAEIEKMEQYLKKGAAAIDVRSFERWDSALHRTLAEAAHNALLLVLFDTMNSVREGRAWGRMKDLTLTSGRKADYQRQHCEIIDAIRDRDSALARRLMRRHLDTIVRNMWGRPDDVDASREVGVALGT